MSGLGRYPLNIPSLSDAFLGSNQRRDRLDYDYDDRRYRERERDRRDDDYRRDSVGSRARSSRDRYSPEPSYSSYLDDERQDVVSYPLGHLNTSRSDRGNNRNDRNRNQNNRDRYRGNNNNSRQNNRGPPNQGPGILGAKPGDRTVPELPTNPLQVPGLGMTGSGLGTGLTAQLAQQQQQLMAMVQTQSLLAAMQAQANANAQAQVQARNKQGMPSPMGLLPTPLIPRNNQSRDMQRQNRKRGRNDSWGGGGNYGNKRERYDNRRQQGVNKGYNQQNRAKQNQQSQPVKKAVTVVQEDKKEAVEEEEPGNEVEEEETAEGDEETEGEELTQEEDKHVDEAVSRKSVEFNDRPLPKSVNFIGEDVDALMISLFDKKRSKYICQQCKIICNIPVSFYKHLLGKRHARTVLEKQGKELDAEEFKNFSQEKSSTKKEEVESTPPVTKAEEKEEVVTPELLSPPAVQSPGSETNLDFVKYTCDTRKTAMKDGNIITISSVTQSRVRIDGFTSGRNMLGCEFVKAVSGFNCRLCKTFIRCGNDVLNHIKGKKHQSNYKTYVQDHPQYEELQLARNKELEAVLRPKEGEEVVLFEVLDKDIETSPTKPRSRRSESQTGQSDEVQITKFVLASQSSDEADDIQCETADLDVDVDGLEQLNEDSLLADESTEENTGMGTTTDEEDILYDPAEITGADEDEEKQAETTADPQEAEDFLSLSVDQPETKTDDLEETEEPPTVTARHPANQWTDQEPDTQEGSQEDTVTSLNVITPEVTPTPPKRGKKGAAKGGATRGGGARGRGRGRGGRRGGRASAAAGRAAKTKKGKVEEDASNNDDVNFMEGFEIIDEIGDGED